MDRSIEDIFEAMKLLQTIQDEMKDAAKFRERCATLQSSYNRFIAKLRNAPADTTMDSLIHAFQSDLKMCDLMDDNGFWKL